MGKAMKLPPFYFQVLLLACFALRFLLPIAFVVPKPWHHLGWLLVAGGVVLNLWADWLFKKHRTTVKPDREPTALITTGPFQVSRHPMYLGMVMILLGTSVLLRVLTPFITPVAFFAVVEAKFMGMEEAAMGQTFGEAYEKYRSTVRKWF